MTNASKPGVSCRELADTVGVAVSFKRVGPSRRTGARTRLSWKTRNRRLEAMHVRRAAPGDAPALLHIWLEASRVGHPFLGEETLQEQLPKLRDVYIPHADNWVAVEREAILGFIGLVENHVGGLFVAPATHRRGVGRLLLDHASERLGELTVEVYEQNRSACSFYLGCGFQTIGRKELDDEGRALPLLRMKKASSVHLRSAGRA